MFLLHAGLAVEWRLMASPAQRHVQRCLPTFHLLLQAQAFVACLNVWRLASSGLFMMCRAQVESEVETAFRESLEQNCYHERARRDNLLRWGRKEQAKNLPTPRQVLARDSTVASCMLPVKSVVCLITCAGH